MKAIILAAGRGTRISRHIDGKPKCTVSLGGGTTLIERSVDQLVRKGVERIVLVLGYRGEVIRSVLAGRPVEYRENPFYDVTNSIASLWFARDELSGGESCILMNGDVFLSEEALDLVLGERRSPVLFYDVSRREEADYKFLCEGDRLVKYGKELSLEETTGEYIGCATFDGDFAQKFGERLSSLIGSQQHSLWWENVLYSMADERPILTRDVGGAFWGEVDYVEDYERILQYASEHPLASRRPGKGASA
ncbi:MAG: phosphocholine cytidylyltransferase family protein [Treponema sp.]|nr:phosphocholine cytidylyltransferase family protein [Treponema sp.]